MGGGAALPYVQPATNEEHMTKSQYAKNLTDKNHPWLRRATLLAGLALLSACSAGTKPSSDRPTAATSKEASMTEDMSQIQRAENTWADSLKTGDVKRLATIIGPTFTFIGPDGQVEDRKAYLAGYEQMAQLGVHVDSVDMYDVDVRIFDDMAVVTGRVIAQVKMQAQLITENVRFTRIYQRSSGGWLMVSGQGTRLAATGS